MDPTNTNATEEIINELKELVKNGFYGAPANYVDDDDE